MESKHAIKLNKLFQCEISDIYVDSQSRKVFKVKIHNRQCFFQLKCREEDVRIIFSRNTKITIEEFHQVLTEYFGKEELIKYYFFKKTSKLKNGDNFSSKLGEGLAKPTPDVDKLLINFLFKGSTKKGFRMDREMSNFWVVFAEQFSIGPTTEAVMKEVQYMKNVIKVTATENTRLNKKIQDLERQIQELTKKNDEQDDNFDKGMRTVGRENEKLRRLIDQNEKASENLKKRLGTQKKDLKLCTVDVSILLSNVARLKDKIHFVLKVLRKKKSEVVSKPISGGGTGGSVGGGTGGGTVVQQAAPAAKKHLTLSERLRLKEKQRRLKEQMNQQKASSQQKASVTHATKLKSTMTASRRSKELGDLQNDLQRLKEQTTAAREERNRKREEERRKWEMEKRKLERERRVANDLKHNQMKME